jgi:hypothetical protein
MADKHDNQSVVDLKEPFGLYRYDYVIQYDFIDASVRIERNHFDHEADDGDGVSYKKPYKVESELLLRRLLLPDVLELFLIDQVYSQGKIQKRKRNSKLEPHIGALKFEDLVDREEPDHWNFVEHHQHRHHEAHPSGSQVYVFILLYCCFGSLLPLLRKVVVGFVGDRVVGPLELAD